MDQNYTNDAMFYYYKDLGENLAWLIKKKQKKKVIKEALLFPHKVIKKVATLSPLSGKKF